MRTTPSRRSESKDTATWLAELEAALDGRARDAEGRYWPILRDYVRSLAPPLDPELARRVHERIAQRAPDRRRLGLPGRAIARRPQLRARPRAAIADSRRAGRLRRALHLPGCIMLHLPGRTTPGLLMRPAVGVAVSVALIVAVVVIAPWESGRKVSASALSPREAVEPGRTRLTMGSSHSTANGGPKLVPSEKLPTGSASHGGAARESARIRAASAEAPREGPSSAEGAEETAGSSAASPAAPAGAARRQELAASITLEPEPGAVQTTSERAGGIAIQNGGYVERSNVAVQHAGTSEATLSLEVPSSKLNLALAALARLAPVDAENQSLQDITDPHEAASRRLADAQAEHRALLKALAQASTEVAIQKLHERLGQVSGAISRDSAALQALTHKANTAEVEVTVVGQSRAPRHHPQTGSGGLTIDRGLHDAGRVLTVAFVVLVVAAAVLLPLTLAVLALGAAWRAWRRYQREQALHAP